MQGYIDLMYVWMNDAMCLNHTGHANSQLHSILIAYFFRLVYLLVYTYNSFSHYYAS